MCTEQKVTSLVTGSDTCICTGSERESALRQLGARRRSRGPTAASSPRQGTPSQATFPSPRGRCACAHARGTAAGACGSQTDSSVRAALLLRVRKPAAGTARERHSPLLRKYTATARRANGLLLIRIYHSYMTVSITYAGIHRRVIVADRSRSEGRARRCDGDRVRGELRWARRWGRWRHDSKCEGLRQRCASDQKPHGDLI